MGENTCKNVMWFSIDSMGTIIFVKHFYTFYKNYLKKKTKENVKVEIPDF